MSTALAILPRIWACQAPPEAFPPALKPLLRRGPAPKPVDHTLAFYRKYTEGMLRRYLQFSLEAARNPSLLGRELFRGKVTSYPVHSFEDAIIFVHDVEKCIAMLDRGRQLLINRIAIQQYTQQEVATALRMPRRTVLRRYGEAIDELTAIFLRLKLLEPNIECQGGASR